MADRGLKRPVARVASAALVAALTSSCGGAAPAAAPARGLETTPARPLEFRSEDASWGRYHSKRFQLSIPLPEGRSWRVDDHSSAALRARHEATGSELVVLTTTEDELMNRQRCEARARELGYVPPDGPMRGLTTVEDAVTVGPDAFDSRVWTAVDPGKPGGAVEGHVFLFGALIRRCLLVHVKTRVASVNDEDVLSARLALARARIVTAITMDPPRITGEATVPREKPEIRR